MSKIAHFPMRSEIITIAMVRTVMSNAV